MNSPCVKDCPGRSPTCHGTCEAYAAYAEERRKIYNKPHLPLSGMDLILTEGRLKARKRAIMKQKYRKHG